MKLETNRQIDINEEESGNLQNAPKTTEMLLDVPFIHQLEAPSLVNGCEVTALAILLNYYEIIVDKNTLANQIESVPLEYASGLKGDPNQGFVGSMTDEVLAMGVFVPPIERLAKNISLKINKSSLVQKQIWLTYYNKLSKESPSGS